MRFSTWFLLIVYLFDTYSMQSMQKYSWNEEMDERFGNVQQEDQKSKSNLTDGSCVGE